MTDPTNPKPECGLFGAISDLLADPSIPAQPRQALDTITLARRHYPGDLERQRQLLELITQGIASGRLRFTGIKTITLTSREGVEMGLLNDQKPPFHEFARGTFPTITPEDYRNWPGRPELPPDSLLRDWLGEEGGSTVGNEDERHAPYQRDRKQEKHTRITSLERAVRAAVQTIAQERADEHPDQPRRQTGVDDIIHYWLRHRTPSGTVREPTGYIVLVDKGKNLLQWKSPRTGKTTEVKLRERIAHYLKKNAPS